jgi:hypothetical protein
MTKFEKAVREAERLPADVRDRLGEDILHFVDKLLALRKDIAIGVEQLDRGETVPAEVVLAELRGRYGA